MSIVNKYTRPETSQELKRQRRMTMCASLVISILAVVLTGVILALVLLPALTLEVETMVAYSEVAVEEEVVERPEVIPQVQRQPSSPSASMARVVASTVPSPVAVPIPDEDNPDPSFEFGDGDDFGAGWGSGSGPGSGGTTFFGQSVKGERIAYVIDYSASMRGQGREDLMRRELSDSVMQLSAKTKYALIFFAGPAWVAGDEVDWTKSGATVSGKGGAKFKWKSKGKANDWEHVGKKQPVDWLDASMGQLSKSKRVIRDTRLVWGTRWDNPLAMALDMDPPPQVICFMTDGAASGSHVWAKEMGARAKRRGVKINCIAMMEPKAHKDMDALAEKTGGQFTIVTKAGERKKVR